MKSVGGGPGIELLLLLAAALCFCFVAARRVSAPLTFEPVAREADVLRVVTWNLGTGVDAGTQGLRREDMKRVVAVLMALEPDLVFLQELSSKGQLDRLRERLGPDWQASMSDSGHGRPMAVLACGGSLSELPTPEFIRAHAVEYRGSAGELITCVVVHADAFSAQARNQTLGELSSYLDSRVVGGRTLIAGDMNLDLSIDQRGDLFSDDEYLDLETYNYFARGRMDVGLGAGSTAKPDRRLDYIFIGAGEFDVLMAGPWLGQRAAEMDHHPLVADLRATGTE